MVRINVEASGRSLEETVDLLRKNLQNQAEARKLPLPEGIAGAQEYKVSLRKEGGKYITGNEDTTLNGALASAEVRFGDRFNCAKNQILRIQATYDLQREGPTPSPAGPDYTSPRKRTNLF